MRIEPAIDRRISFSPLWIAGSAHGQVTPRGVSQFDMPAALASKHSRLVLSACLTKAAVAPSLSPSIIRHQLPRTTSCLPRAVGHDACDPRQKASSRHCCCSAPRKGAGDCCDDGFRVGTVRQNAQRAALGYERFSGRTLGGHAGFGWLTKITLAGAQVVEGRCNARAARQHRGA